MPVRARGEPNTQEVDVHVVLLAAQESAEVAHHLPIPPVGMGLLALGVLLSGLLVTYAFKSVGTRH